MADVRTQTERKTLLILFGTLLLISGCTSKSVVETVVEKAKNNIETVVKDKPECESVGIVCNNEIDNINTVCVQQIDKSYSDGWDKGFKKGIIITIIFAILAFIGLKKVFK